MISRYGKVAIYVNSYWSPVLTKKSKVKYILVDFHPHRHAVLEKISLLVNIFSFSSMQSQSSSLVISINHSPAICHAMLNTVDQRCHSTDFSNVLLSFLVLFLPLPLPLLNTIAPMTCLNECVKDFENLSNIYDFKASNDTLIK